MRKEKSSPDSSQAAVEPLGVFNPAMEKYRDKPLSSQIFCNAA
jgi:hypothetical protein